MIVSRLAESELASAVALGRCSSRFKDLAAPLVANAVSVTNEKWRDAASKIVGRVGAKITGALERNEVQTNLNLAGCNIGDESAKAIGSALAVNNVLKSLSLPFNRISAAGAAAIAEALRGNEVLTSLDVGDNKIGPTGATAIAEALRVNEVLTQLILDGHELDLPKLRGTDPVESLDLSRKGLELGPASAIVIASLIAGNEVLTELQLASNQLCGIDYRGRGTYSVAGITAIAEALKVNEVLTTLNLGYNQIRGEGAAAIAEALRGNAVLAKLNLDSHELDLPQLRGTNPVTSLKLSYKKLGPASAIVIASLIGFACNAVLTNLNLNVNNIRDEGATAIAEALRVNGVLKTLGLGGNNIGDDDAAAIAEALAVNGVLTNLDLFSNSIGDEGAKALASALRVNGVL
ncbi:hypothetical protein EMIHUDRAFT_113049 [Emiliania huxleyi CCMP1516]|uniref:Uncharacterized protein n=2 Tax=Emiliania huxleyi TaxID=2903 RepID=A0A0D3K4U4_EMIH1|nr:hypothetical protein EMIHUDRAFT_113049 [Emiliania huxleyi CCMP1516]EOD30779.1 hypothetical protein EMIHUDRAFT_113049 [Emiliania huxleyi CCMP1516]|eukprot:XP_005783208.1 hypothetical protein EMIHUDRAFT_113049 [Emiliania huxleyi CCMP1516]